MAVTIFRKLRPTVKCGLQKPCRYVSSPEAVWRLQGFALHQEAPSVERLAVHEPGKQLVMMQPGEQLPEAAARAAKTTLTAYFDRCDKDPVACTLLYTEFPEKYAFHRQEKEWRPRQKGPAPIGRMYMAHPSDVERFHIRLLLCHVRGAKCHDDLRTVEGVRYPTFKEAAARLGLLEDDAEWDAAMEEAASMQSPASLRQLFAALLLCCSPANPQALWNKHQASLTEDLLHRRRQVTGNPLLPLGNDIIDAALLEVQHYLEDQMQTLSNYGMRVPRAATRVDAGLQRLRDEELAYDQVALAAEVEQNLQLLNADQRAVWEAVRGALDDERPQANIFFVDGPGGTGKTFVYSIMLAHVRSQGQIALAVASSGIAALLLKGGRTAHSRFKIPLDLDRTSTCSMSVDSDVAALVREAKLIVWDEAPMTHKHVFEAVDRTLRDVMRVASPELQHRPFGGKVVVLGGDFRQVLPVVRHGTQGQIVDASLKRSTIWRRVKVLKLSINMRVQRMLAADAAAAAKQQDFADYLLRVGEGREQTYPLLGDSMIRLPESLCCPTELLDDLLTEVFGADIGSLGRNIISRGILTPKNVDVDLINSKALARFPGQVRTYLSADRASGTDHDHTYPVEFLNTLAPNGLPPHKLELKLNAPAMLLRNMNGAKGQANGTRVIIRGFMRHVIDVEIATGNNIGARVFIPRITLIPSDSGLPFDLKRRQFPLRPAFAMTINKSQGQTMDRVGLYLPQPVFSHGQMYVALSRVGSPDNIKVMVQDGRASDNSGVYTRNVVYREVFE